MSNFILNVSFSVIILFFILNTIYFRFQYKNGTLEKLIGFTYLLIGFVYWLIHINFTGDILFFPHLYRIGGGVWMLTAVLLYYCARLVFKKSITWKEHLILIPVFLYFINFSPFIVHGSEYKKEIISQVLLGNNTYSFNEGWFFSGKFVLILRISHRLLCAFLIGALFWKKNGEIIISYGNKTIVYFYFWFVLLSSLPELYSVFDFDVIDGISIPSSLYLILAFAFLILYFLSPRLLYGNSKMISKVLPDEDFEFIRINPNVKSFLKIVIPDEELSQKERINIFKIESHIENIKPYLDGGFSLSQLESSLGIPAKKISLCIKNKYNLNFNQFINRHRIEYVLAMLERDKKWRNYSVESLALNVGFNSTNSFYNYFKIVTKMTPREYIDLLSYESEKEAATQK